MTKKEENNLVGVGHPPVDGGGGKPEFRHGDGGPESGRSQSNRNISVGSKILNVKTQDMFMPRVDNSRY